MIKLAEHDEIKARDKDSVAADWKEQNQLALKEIAEARLILDKLETRIKRNEFFDYGAMCEYIALEDQLSALITRKWEWDRLSVELRKWRDEHR